MMILIFVIILQLVIAAIVIFVLKGLLDRELEHAAIEKFTAYKISTGCTILICSARSLSEPLKEEFNRLVMQKSKENKIEFKELVELKGGLVIKIADDILDFSVSTRLKNFWS